MKGVSLMLEKICNALDHYHILLKYKILYRNKLKIGKKTRFRGNSRFSIINNAKVVIGNSVFINNGCSINSRSSIVIGDNTIIGEGVKIYDHNHKFNKIMKKAYQGFSTANVKIGNNCWIGSNVIILKGVEVGNNTVIGAGVVLDESVGDNVVVTANRKIEVKAIKYKERDL